MKARNVVDEVTTSGLYFITSGEVRKAIGRQDPFKGIVDPADRVKRIEALSKTLKTELNSTMMKKAQTLSVEKKSAKKA